MLSKVLDELDSGSVRAAEAEAAYKVGYAKALIAAEAPTVALREAQATVACESLLFERLVSDRLVTVSREKLAAYRASIDALRTLMVGLRANI